MINVLKLSKININNIDIDKPEKINKHYYSNIRYDNEPLYIQTSKIINYKDMKDFESKDPYIEVEIDDLKIYDIISKIDDHILKSTKENWKLWMDKDIPLEILENMYIKLSKTFKQDVNPKFKFKIPISKSKILTKIYDNNKIDIDIKQIKKQQKIIMIMNIRGIKYNEKTFYLDIYVTQIKVFNEKQELNEFCLIQSESDNEEDVLNKQELNELVINNKLQELISQKKEDLELLNQIKLRIENINKEINLLNLSKK